MDERMSASHRESRKLYKSPDDRMIDGVCGGIAEYLSVDSSVVRLLLVAFSILSIGAGILFYIIAMLVIPMKPLEAQASSEPGRQVGASSAGATVALAAGIIIVIIGITLLFNYYSIFSVASLWHYFGGLALPVVFILIGGALLLGREKGAHRPDLQSGPSDQSVDAGEGNSAGAFAAEMKGRLTRSAIDKKIAGVCGGLAEYLGVDATIVRLVFVLLAIASFGLALILYIVCAFLIPKEMNR